MITYIVGTDTGVGKTYYGRKLVTEGKRVIKPIETGKDDFEDIMQSDCYTYSSMQDIDISDINLYFFNVPASPHYAAELDGEKVDIEKLKSFVSSNTDIYVELAGGLFVPLDGKYTQLDLIKDTPNCNVDIVVANKLGCLNHAILTVETLRSNNIAISKLVINNMGKKLTDLAKNNIKTIKEFYADTINIEVI